MKGENNMKKLNFLFHTLMERYGMGEETKLEQITTIKDNESKLKISFTISESFDIKDYNKAVDLYERLGCGGGRRMYKLDELAHHYNPNK